MTGGSRPVFPATVRLSAAWSPAVPAVPAQVEPQHPAAVPPIPLPPSTIVSKSRRTWQISATVLVILKEQVPVVE